MDSISDHIIKIANSHLVSPVVSTAVGSLVAKISEELQGYIISESELTEEQKNAQEHGQPIGKLTVRSQINANAAQFTVAYQTRQNIAYASEVKQKEYSEKNPFQGSGTCAKEEGQRPGGNDGPTNVAELFAMASANGINIKVVDDPNYKVTKEDVDNGVRIVLHQKSTETGQPVGHFNLLGGNSVTASLDGGGGRSNDDMNCGYDVMSQLTGKTAAQLRNELDEIKQENPIIFNQINSCSEWIWQRHPEKAVDYLMISGRRGLQANDLPNINHMSTDGMTAKEIMEMYDEHMQQALELDSIKNCKFTPTEHIWEGKGSVYILSTTVKGQKVYKLGMTKRDVQKRVDELERENNENYTIERTVEVPNRFYAETISHLILANNHEIRKGIAGGTEYFNAPLPYMERTIAFVQQYTEAMNPITPEVKGYVADEI